MTEISTVLGEAGVADPFAGHTAAAPAGYAPFSFTSKRFALVGLCEKAIPVVPSRDYQPVLSNFMVRVSAQGLRFAATDLELMITVHSPVVQVDGIADGAYQDVVLPARRLLAILREAPEGEVTITVSADSALITAGQASWTIKLSSDGNDFPAIPGLSEVTLHETPRQALVTALKAVRHAVSKAGAKPRLSQVDIRKATDGVMKVTASDGPRFAQVPLPGFPVAMRIPAAGTPAATDELVRMLTASEAETIQVGFLAKKMVFSFDSTVFTVDPLQEDFPDVETLLLAPAMMNDQSLTVDRSELVQAVHRVRVNADRESSAIGLKLTPGKMTVFARDTYQNQAEETIDAGWTGGTRQLVVNYAFLLDMLSVYSGASCQFRLGKDVGKRRSALLLRDDKFTGVLTQMVASLLGY